MNINNIEISPLERTVIIAGIKSYLKQNYIRLEDMHLKVLNIHGITENELIAVPDLRCGLEQTHISPQYMSIEHDIIQAILTHTMLFGNLVGGVDSSEYLSNALLEKSYSSISKEGAKFLGQVVLQEPNLILRILNEMNNYYDENVFKEINKDHIIQSLKLNPELKKDYIFKVFNVKDLEGLVNVVIRKISQRARKEEDEFLLEAAVDVLQQTDKISKIFSITTNIGNDTKHIGLNHDINQILSEYLPDQDIISLLKMAIESVDLINEPPDSRHEPLKLKHQMSALGLEDQASSGSNRLSVEPLMGGSVKIVAETRQFS